MVWLPVKHAKFVDQDSGIVRPELDMLRAVKVTF